MDIPLAEKGTVRAPKNLTKNSIIAVTIDDLNEGLIVVSFPHEGNLYQGVLLQLNRERGIPSGISFPKDYCTGSVVEPLGENDPTQIPPLPQRHTYFQDRDGSLADPMKSRLALRRVIKPPARFKNSRMSLRLRSRPILCAKCRTLCEDKVNSQASDSQDDGELSKKIISGGGVTTRRGKSTMGVSLTSNVPSSQESEPTQDYSYVSVGSKSFIENYWKRPSLLPTPDEKVGRSNSSTPLPSGQGGPQKPPIDSMVVVKSVPKMPKINSCMNENKLTLTLTKDNNNKVLPKLLVSSNPGFEKTVKIKKSKTIKAYKAKLLNDSSSPDQVEKPVDSRESDEIPEEKLGDQYGGSTASLLLPELNLDPVDAGLKDDPSSNPKMWENRIRKKSTVPARFRDEGYVTKNIFSFKRRRVEDDAIEEEGSPEHHLSPFEEVDQESVEKESNKLSPTPADTSSSSDISRTSGTPSFPLPPSVGSVGGTNGHADIKVEPAKTPVIKITFGTPGNGVVVEIPPKAKQEEAGIITDKAARKAMKKAKKEARRKLSLSREPSPSAKPALPQTPSPPASNSDIAPVQNSVEPEPTTPELPLDANVLEPYHVSKKKKKEKKKKRNKPTKDNCDSTVSQGGSTPPYEDLSEHCDRVSPTPAQPLSSNDPEIEVSPVSPDPPAVESDDNNKNIEDSPESKTGRCTASSTEAPQRLCISLKRLNDNSMVSWDITQSCITCSHNELDSGEPEQVGSPTSSEPNDYPMNDSPSSEHRNANASSIDSYTDECRNYLYKKGDIVWGKLPGCPWWPGKILDILFVDVDDVIAKVSWYRASTLSCIRFSQLGPFAEQFETRYTRSRKRGSYQHAVRDALIEAHQLDPNDLPSD